MFCAALLGDLDDAAEQSRSLDSTPAHEAVVHEQPRRLAEQWIVAQRGDAAGASQALRSMAAVAYEAGRYGDVVRALLDATRLIGDAGPAAAGSSTTTSTSTAGCSRPSSTGSSPSIDVTTMRWRRSPSGSSSRRMSPYWPRRRRARHGPSLGSEALQNASWLLAGAGPKSCGPCSDLV